MSWEQEVKAAAEKAAKELYERFAPYPAELTDAPRRRTAVGSTQYVRREDLLKQLQWQMRRDDVRKFFARALGVDPS
jgi:hypothetical protein